MVNEHKSTSYAAVQQQTTKLEPLDTIATATTKQRKVASVATKKGRRRYVCNICTKEFAYGNDLKKHLLIHSNEKPYQCLHCGLSFRQAGGLRNHIACQHGTDVMFICHYCNKSFPIKERLRLHMRIHSGVKPYKCTLCPKEFARGGQLNQHMQTHNVWKKYNCQQCSSIFSSIQILKDHVKKHLELKDCTCEYCGKTFLKPYALNKHYLGQHKNDKSFYCNICKRAFKGDPSEHVRDHEKDKLYGCTLCPAKFAQSSQLRVHERIHTGERPYRCQVCWQTFGHSSVLKLHIRKHTGEKPFKCSLCKDTSFSQLPHLKNHMRTIHNCDKSYLCTVCKEYFKTKNDLQLHNVICINQDETDEKIVEQEAADNYRKMRVENIDSLAAANALTQMRLLVAVLLKKISTKERLKQLGFEKRLIDNVLIAALKLANQPFCEDAFMSDMEKLRVNVRQFLQWTVPESMMTAFQSQQKSVEELLEELTAVKAEEI